MALALASYAECLATHPEVDFGCFESQYSGVDGQILSQVGAEFRKMPRSFVQHDRGSFGVRQFIAALASFPGMGREAVGS